MASVKEFKIKFHGKHVYTTLPMKRVSVEFKNLLHALSILGFEILKKEGQVTFLLKEGNWSEK